MTAKHSITHRSPSRLDVAIIYTIGYAASTPEAVRQQTHELGAILVDIRQSPRSRDARWSGVNVMRLVGADHYMHLDALGNVNYKQPERGIELADIATAVDALLPLLMERDIILMCACRDVEQCHRKLAAEVLALATGATIVHLTSQTATTTTKQLSLLETL